MCNECIKKGKLDELVVNKIIVDVDKHSPVAGDMITIRYDNTYYDLEDVHDSLDDVMKDYIAKGVTVLVIDKHYEVALKKGQKPKDGDGVLRDLLDIMSPNGGVDE